MEPQLENPNFVVRLIPRPIEQRSRSGVTLFFEKADRVLARTQFLAISRLKFLPLRRITAESFAKFRARRHFLEPQVHRRPRGIQVLICEASFIFLW